MTFCWPSCAAFCPPRRALRTFSGIIAGVTGAPPSKTTLELLAYLFDGQPHPIAEPIGHWLGASRRYTAFVTTFRDKIRKKLRIIQEPATLLDLRLELETAYLLLQEKSLSVVYERKLGRVRAPDFEVAFTTRLIFMLEVTRLRPAVREAAAPAVSERIVEALLDKLSQFLPQRSNVLLIGVEAPLPTLTELQNALVSLLRRAEANESPFLRQRGFRDRAEFFRQFQRLSAILVRRSPAGPGLAPIAWTNPQARQPLPGRVLATVQRSQTL